MEINKDITIEELIEKYPFSVQYLSKKGIRCIVCGEPVWGTLEEACEEKDFTPEQIEEVLVELNELSKQNKNKTNDDKTRNIIETRNLGDQ